MTATGAPPRRRPTVPRPTRRRDESVTDTPLLELRGRLEALRRRAGAVRGRLPRRRRARSWPSSATTAPASRRSSSASPASTRSTRARSSSRASRCTIHGPKDAARARHRGRLPGPRAVPTTSTSSRTCSSAARSSRPLRRLDETTMEQRARETLSDAVGDDDPLGAPDRRRPLRRPAPVGRGRQGRDVELASS